MTKEVSLEDIVSLCKRRGFVFPASDIYGGISGFHDYGPLGVELANKIKHEWWTAMVTNNDNIYGVDGAIIQNPKLWKASGHVDGFTDPLVDCRNCGARHRADHLAGTDSNDLSMLKDLLKDKACPSCGKKELTEPRTYNMMLKTFIGPTSTEVVYDELQDESGDSITDHEGDPLLASKEHKLTYEPSTLAYLRPETAGSIFTNFENVRETMRAKLPFGVAQIGKAFRNEISPRDFIFRTRELEQMEMQYFISPDDQADAYQRWRDFAWSFVTKNMGIAPELIKWHEHEDHERAHYAADAHDVYFKFPFGFKELLGTHNRTDFDLTNHQKASGKDLRYFDVALNKKFIPYVIESSMGLGRMFLAVLTDAYTEEEINGDKRVVLKLAKNLVPYKVAVSPLLKNKPELAEKAREVYALLKESLGNVIYDDNGNIGKRYRRQDEIGTPYCVTIDFDTLDDDSVTVRDRDTTKQERIKIADLIEKMEQ